MCGWAANKFWIDLNLLLNHQQYTERYHSTLCIDCARNGGIDITDRCDSTVSMVLGQNGTGRNGTDKMQWPKWYRKNGTNKILQIKSSISPAPIDDFFIHGTPYPDSANSTSKNSDSVPGRKCLLGCSLVWLVPTERYKFSDYIYEYVASCRWAWCTDNSNHFITPSAPTSLGTKLTLRLRWSSSSFARQSPRPLGSNIRTDHVWES